MSDFIVEVKCGEKWVHVIDFAIKIPRIVAPLELCRELGGPYSLVALDTIRSYTLFQISNSVPTCNVVYPMVDWTVFALLGGYVPPLLTKQLIVPGNYVILSIGISIVLQYNNIDKSNRISVKYRRRVQLLLGITFFVVRYNKLLITICNYVAVHGQRYRLK